MLLRVSGANHSLAYDLNAVMQPERASGVAHGDVLLELVDASLEGGKERCAAARERVVRTLGPDALIDAAGVIAMFSQADRMADGAGIPLDEPLQMMTGDIRAELDLRRFASSANTPEP